MGRRSVELRYKTEEKARLRTFKNRIRGLTKMVFELATLCDIPALLICSSPSGRTFTWPQDEQTVNGIISMFKSLPEEKQIKNKHDLRSHLKRDDEKLRAKLARQMLTPNDLLMLDVKIEAIKDRINFLRSQKLLKIETLCVASFGRRLNESMQSVPFVNCSEWEQTAYSNATMQHGLDFSLDISDYVPYATDQFQESDFQILHVNHQNADLESFGCPILMDPLQHEFNDKFSDAEIMHMNHLILGPQNFVLPTSLNLSADSCCNGHYTLKNSEFEASVESVLSQQLSEFGNEDINSQLMPMASIHPEPEPFVCPTFADPFHEHFPTIANEASLDDDPYSMSSLSPPIVSSLDSYNLSSSLGIIPDECYFHDEMDFGLWNSLAEDKNQTDLWGERLP